jgi:hypothetical protein
MSKRPAWLQAWLISAACLLWTPVAAPAEQPISLALPIACQLGTTCFIQNYMDGDPSSGIRDYNCGDRTYDGHDGTDIRLPSLEAQRAGVDVVAAAAGTVTGVRDGMADISIRAPGAQSVKGRECGNGVVLTHSGGWVTQYCHMARGSIRVKKGQSVEAGDPLGRVGLSGDTEFPHLHFAVRLQTTKIDPFAYGARGGECGGGASLWNASLRTELHYRQREVINMGFAAGPVTMEEIESGEAQRHPPEPNSLALVAYVRAIGLEAGDAIELAISAPDGSLVAQQRDNPLDHSKAQYFLMVGRKRHAAPWPGGVYTARYKVQHESKDVLEKTFTFTLPPPN